MPRLPLDDRFGPPAPAVRLLDGAPPPHPRWLWPTRLPLGALSLLVGDPGVGKSLLTADLAARLSVPHPWPDDPPQERPDPAARCALPAMLTDDALRRADPPIRGFTGRQILPASVVLASAEDRAVLPQRLAAAGADPLYVSILDGVRPPGSDDVLPLCLPTHADQLEQAIRDHDHPRLVVLDPVHAFFDQGVYCSPDRQAALLARLAALALRTGVALLAVGHLARDVSRRIVRRIRGPVSLVAAARSILLLTAHPDRPDRRILTQIKNVYGPPASPLAFRIVPGPRLEWDPADAADGRLADAVLDLTPESYSALSDACDWLADALSAGPRPARDLLREARAVGHSVRTLHRAKRLLAVRSVHPDRVSPWLWTADLPTSPKDCQNAPLQRWQSWQPSPNGPPPPPPTVPPTVPSGGCR